MHDELQLPKGRQPERPGADEGLGEPVRRDSDLGLGRWASWDLVGRN